MPIFALSHFFFKKTPNMHAENFYQKQLERSIEAIKASTKSVRFYTFTRLILFCLIALSVYFFWSNNSVVSISLVVGFFLFLIAVNKSLDANLKLEKAKQWKKINESELKALQGDWSDFDCGAEFTDPKHAFSLDLDLFAKKGVFSFLNRTTNANSKKRLADQLLYGTKNTAETQARIEALKNEMDWTQQFRVAGSINSRESANEKSLAAWSKNTIVNSKMIRVFYFLNPIISIPFAILYYFDFISGLLFSSVFLLFIPIARELKNSTALFNEVGKMNAKVSVLLEQIQLLKTVKDPVLIAFKNEFLSDDSNAEKALRDWMKIQKQIDLRLNMLLTIPINLFFAWDFRQRIALENWQKKYSDSVQEWEVKMDEMEVYISGATVLFNRPEMKFASFHTEKEIKIEGLFHPLLAKEKSIANDFSFDSINQFMILTGPNMAGKSTYLRSLALTFILANAGFPVAATKVEIPRLHLYSSMRTSDDLASESSYFHAELSRLRYIMDEIEKGEPIFLILDEILKGTNSKDKAEGSRKFLQKLQKLGARGIIATHDLSICELAEDDPHFVNACFDSQIEGNELFFDYKVRPGICQNMNASFLLKQMRLVE